MDPFEATLAVFRALWLIIAATWWLFLPLILFLVFRMAWLFYIQTRYKMGLKWVMLEIKIPREILKTPKAMEQIFANFHGMDPDVKWHEKWFLGMVPPWASWELVGYAGGVYFYVRVYKIFRNLAEAAIYAQYPSAEIREANDYTELLPKDLPNKAYDIFGSNFILVKDDAYPIRTYEYFEALEEERRVDPMAAITEVMSKLKEGEMIWLQILIEPIPADWVAKGDAAVNKLLGVKETKKASLISEIVGGFGDALFPSEKEEKLEPKPPAPPPGAGDMIKGIGAKTAKIAFRTNIRFIVIDNRERFTKANVAAVFGYFSQFNTQNLNAFKPDKAVITKGKWPFKKWKAERRKKFLYQMYLAREFAARSSILNIEELAAIFHFPIQIVEAPKLQRIEAKKGEPPPNLPIA